MAATVHASTDRRPRRIPTRRQQPSRPLSPEVRISSRHACKPHLIVRVHPAANSQLQCCQTPAHRRARLLLEPGRLLPGPMLHLGDAGVGFAGQPGRSRVGLRANGIGALLEVEIVCDQVPKGALVALYVGGAPGYDCVRLAQRSCPTCRFRHDTTLRAGPRRRQLQRTDRRTGVPASPGLGRRPPSVRLDCRRIRSRCRPGRGM